jgi:chorismate synthase
MSTGGGRASGRETVGRVAAGVIAKKLISPVEVVGHVVEVGGIKARPRKFEDIKRDVEKTIISCTDLNTAKLMIQKIKAVQSKGDSIGGIVEVIAEPVPAGLGEPVFDKLSADLAKAMMSIPGVKGFEIGAGFRVSKMKGSQNNDAFAKGPEGFITRTNNAGGILGGISTGMPIVVRIAVKPTSSISVKQNTVNLKTGKSEELSTKGRHDPCLCPRIVPVAEAMMAIVLAEHLLRSKSVEKF